MLLPTLNKLMTLRVYGSVVFSLNQKQVFRTENVSPYCLFGDTVLSIDPPKIDYYIGWLPKGYNTIKATVYSKVNGKGEVIFSSTISFTVIDKAVPTIVEVFEVRTPNGEILQDVSIF
jgi:hypothetical protein